MKSEEISRAYLETLSFAGLVELADEYGIDVPENLDRRLLIGELLEIADEESNHSAEESMVLASDEDDNESVKFPDNYNETQISGIFRNPAWLFVFWNLNDNDYHNIKKHPELELKIRLCFYNSEVDGKVEDFIEITASDKSQEQYILLPAGKKFVKIELILGETGASKVLAFSSVMAIPQSSKYMNDIQPGKEMNFPEIIRISGAEKVLINQYNSHRNLFS